MIAGGMDLRRLHRYHTINPIWQKKLKHTVQALDDSRHDTIVASEENLMGTMPGVRSKGFYPHFHRLVRGMGRLQMMLDGKVTIAPRLVIRRQDKYLESVYAFRVSRGMDRDFHRFVRSATRRSISWLRLARHLASLPSPVEPRIALLEAWPKGRAAAQALQFLIGDHDLEPSVRRLTGNTRHSPVALRLILALNKAGIVWQEAPWRQDVFDIVEIYREDPHADIRFALQGRLSKREFGRFERYYSPEAKLGFSSDERAEFLSEYADENHRLLALDIVGSPADAWDFEG